MPTTNKQAKLSAANVQSRKSATNVQAGLSSTYVASSIGSPHDQSIDGLRITQGLQSRITQSGSFRIING